MINKKITVLILFLNLFLFVGCSDSKAKEYEEMKNNLDLISFLYIEEYPISISKLIEEYPDTLFEKKVFDAIITQLGDYSYVLKTDEVSFVFNGDNETDAILYNVDIYSSKYEKKQGQLIDMEKSDLLDLLPEAMSFREKEDEIIINSIDNMYYLRIRTQEEIIVSYKNIYP